MTPEAQRIAIAEACGWGDILRGPYDNQPFGRHKTHELLPLPDYLSDLNACHEAEKTLTDKNGYQCHGYVEMLNCVLWRANKLDPSPFGLLHATAAQRAEAFLKTLNKWTD